jgi:hypothetical protein
MFNPILYAPKEGCMQRANERTDVYQSKYPEEKSA